MGKLMHFLPEMMLMIKGMVVGLRSAAVAFMLIISITYVFAIVFRQLSAGTAIGGASFRSVPSAMVSLLVDSALPDNADMIFSLATAQTMLGVLYFVFLFLTALTIMNMLLGLLCDKMSQVAKESAKE